MAKVEYASDDYTMRPARARPKTGCSRSQTCLPNESGMPDNHKVRHGI